MLHIAEIALGIDITKGSSCTWKTGSLQLLVGAVKAKNKKQKTYRLPNQCYLRALTAARTLHYLLAADGVPVVPETHQRLDAHLQKHGPLRA